MCALCHLYTRRLGCIKWSGWEMYGSMAAVFARRKRHRGRWSAEQMLDTAGPICAAVCDVKASVEEAMGDVQKARALLALPVRVGQEAALRAGIFYFWCLQTGPVPEKCDPRVKDDRPLTDWEKSLNALQHEKHIDVVCEARAYTCAMRAQGRVTLLQRLEHLERIVYHARRLAKLATECTPPPPDVEDTVSAWLPTVCVFCQSDVVQKKCRELYLFISVSPYEMESTDSPNPFSCLCTVANERVNELVERASAPLQAVVKAGAEAHPHVYAIAALCIFCEFVRCKRALDTPIHTLHDGHTARDGSFLIETTTRMYVRYKQAWEGPYEHVGEIMTRWEKLYGVTDRSDLVPVET